ncbi:MAG TPA: hypothetical protein DCY85_06680 [Firmicutes bacterium]|jgi:hypothetical protein|nr:hypothetical protein [Bacillota bacterium]HBE06159.1 hypothetical protein [Bacillota bacterium]HCF92428.1 hypothetical protein [Bacillota bacterium]
MNWELLVTAILAVIGGLTVIGWLAHFILRRGAILKPTITLHFIIKNCATEVEGALRSLLLFSRPFQRWTLGRIKITDCHSTDETAAIVRRLAAKTPIIELIAESAARAGCDGEYDGGCAGGCDGGCDTGIELIVRAGDINGWDLRSACDAVCTLLD